MSSFFPLIIILLVIFQLVMRSARKAQQQQKQQVQQRYPAPMPSQNYRTAQQTRPQPVNQYPAASHLCEDDHAAERASGQTALTNMEAGYNVNPWERRSSAPQAQYPAASHLCDDDHALERLQGKKTLDDLEPGYSQTSGAQGTDFMTKRELEDLRKAGIISSSEYYERVNQR